MACPAAERRSIKIQAVQSLEIPHQPDGYFQSHAVLPFEEYRVPRSGEVAPCSAE
jgi:hypothetical protein